MAAAAKTASQVIAHTGIAFSLNYQLNGSAMWRVGGITRTCHQCDAAALARKNVAESSLRTKTNTAQLRYWSIAAEKISQTGMHITVAFSLMYWVSGSVVFGGMAAVLEPICNVILLPFHAWETCVPIWKERRRQRRPCPSPAGFMHRRFSA